MLKVYHELNVVLYSSMCIIRAQHVVSSLWQVVNSKLKMVHKLHSDLAKACIELSEIERTLGASLQAAAGNMDT